MKGGFYLNPKTQQPQYSVSGYYVSEKFDGMRAQWDPLAGSLVSRLGNTVCAPKWFLDTFRDVKIPLDGELFFGYGNWNVTGVCRAKTQQAMRDNEPVWHKARYLVFDLPDTDRGTYLERYALLERCPSIGKWGSTETPIWLIPHKKVTGSQMLEEFYQSILDRGGEGVMLNNPETFYVNGRTDHLLKYKPVMDDECIIVGYKPGNGRNTGRLGAFIVHPIEDSIPDPCREFSISGMTDLVRTSYKKSHPIGTIIRYCCTEYTKNGKPRHPRYLGVCSKPVTLEAEKGLLHQIPIEIPDSKAEPKRARLQPKLRSIPLKAPAPAPAKLRPKLRTIGQSVAESRKIDLVKKVTP